MTDHITLRVDDPELADAIESAEEEHGLALGSTPRGGPPRLPGGHDDDHPLPKAAREGYAALREHYNVGDRVGKEQALSIMAQRIRLEKDDVQKGAFRKLHSAGWIAVERGMYRVGVVIRPRTASDGGRDPNNGDADVLNDDRDTDDGVDEQFERLDAAEPATDGGKTDERDDGTLRIHAGPNLAVEVDADGETAVYYDGRRCW